jgi:hypothetical protein
MQNQTPSLVAFTGLLSSYTLESFTVLFFLTFHPAAVLLCAESSFWYKSCSFLDAFKQAVKSYMVIGVEKNGENVVKALGDWPVGTHEQEIYRSALTNILFEHRLRASDSVLITICF